MKKLLSILTISTLTASVPAPLLANATLERTKRDVSTLSSNLNAYLPLKEIDGINSYVFSIAVDSKDNIYFGTDDGAFVLKHGKTTPTKINGINGQLNSFTWFKTKYLYFGTKNGAYVIHSALTSLEWVKQQSQFTLVDSRKTQTWTRPDLLNVDGELNIRLLA